MNTEHIARNHASIHAATVVDRSNPLAPKRRIAQDIVSSSRRLRARIGILAGVCIGLAVLFVAFE